MLQPSSCFTLLASTALSYGIHRYISFTDSKIAKIVMGINNCLMLMMHFKKDVIYSVGYYTYEAVKSNILTFLINSPGLLIECLWLYYAQGNINANDIWNSATFFNNKMGTIAPLANILSEKPVLLFILYMAKTYASAFIVQNTMHSTMTFLHSSRELSEHSKLNLNEKFSDGSTLSAAEVLRACKVVEDKLKLHNIKYYVSCNPICNAVALWAKENSVMIINRGFINAAIRCNDNNREEAVKMIQGLVAHEMGHIVYKHNVVPRFYETVIEGLGYAFNHAAGTAIASYFSRQHEYEADNVAISHGYSDGLKKYLNMLRGRIQDYPSNTQKCSWLNYLTNFSLSNIITDFSEAAKEWSSSHPATFMRCRNIEKNGSVKLSCL